MSVLQCGVCGIVADYTTPGYFDFCIISRPYHVGFRSICHGCGGRANSFINYYGPKRDEDLAALHQFLISGVLPMRDFSALMNAGYWV